MSRPFLVLHTAFSGEKILSNLLTSHPQIKLLESGWMYNQSGKRRPEKVMFNALSRFWKIYDEPARQAKGVFFRVSAVNDEWPAEGLVHDLIQKLDPAIFVLRDDDYQTQAARMLHDQAKDETGGAVEAKREVYENFVKIIRRDNLRLTNALPSKGPIYELSRSEAVEMPNVIFADIINRLGVRKIELGDGYEPIIEPELEALLTNPEMTEEFF